MRLVAAREIVHLKISRQDIALFLAGMAAAVFLPLIFK